MFNRGGPSIRGVCEEHGEGSHATAAGAGHSNLWGDSVRSFFGIVFLESHHYIH